MTFSLRWRPQIFNDMLATLLANSDITDIYPASVVSTLLQAPAIEDARQYAMMMKILEAFNLDTIEGVDLDNKAFEYGLTRYEALGSSGYVTITDSSITKVQTNIYPGTPGPISGATTINSVSASGFPTSGSIIVGRGTTNVETVPYSSFTDNSAYFTFNLSSGLANDHGTEESIILSQAGNRIVGSGTIVEVPKDDVSPAIQFTINSEQTVLDGEDTLEGVAVTCSDAGSATNIPAGAIIEFTSKPFTGAGVTNPLPFVNGSDAENDQELRDRIRSHGVADSSTSGIINSITGMIDTDENKRVVSAGYVSGSTALNTYNTIYIDDGTGFEPSYEGQGVEIVIQEAAGSEQTIQLQNYPLVKASLVTGNVQPFNISSGQTLIIDVDGTSETITFQSGDFTTSGAASAIEITSRINASSNLVEARTSEGETKVIITVKAESNERLQILGGTANAGLAFVEDNIVETLRLYKNDEFLYKDGRSARVETANLVSDMDFSGGPFTFDILIDGISSNTITVTINSADFVDPSNPTAAEIVKAINDDLVGATASSILNGTKIRLSSNKDTGSNSKLNIQAGGSALGSGKLDFPIGQVVGIDADYILNRFNGQILLATPLVALDKVEAGSRNTRGFIDCISPEPYDLTSGQTLVVAVDGGGNETYTFSLTGTYNAQDIIDAINADIFNLSNNLPNCTFESVNKGGVNYLRVRTNCFDNGTVLQGSMEVKSTSTAVGLDFTYNTVSESIQSNVAYSLTHNVEPFTLGINQTAVIELDGDATNRTFSVAVNTTGTVTGGTSTTVFSASGLTSTFSENDFFIGFTVRFDDTTATAGLRSQTSTVTDYNGTTGQFTVSPALTDTPASGDTFSLIPVTALNVVSLFKKPQHTTLGIFSEISVVNDERVQISSLLNGSAGEVQVIGGTANDFSIPLTSDGTGVGTFTIASTSGLSISLDVTIGDDNSIPTNAVITDITGSGSPFTITVDNGGTNLSAYTTSQNAVLRAQNPLNFPNEVSVGVDGYQNFTGLLRKVQRTIDGWDQDIENYPGLKASGSVIAVNSPLIQSVSVEVNVTTVNGVNILTITDFTKSVIASYINGLKVGEDVVLSEIIARVKKITGVYDVRMTTPTVNIPVADDAVARIDLDHITVS